MVNQTSEFQVLGSGSTFKRSFISIFTSAHPRTLLEPAESSSRSHVLLLPQSCHIDFLRLAKAWLWRHVAGWLVRDVPKDRCGPWMTCDPSRRRETLPQRHGVVSQSSATTTLQFHISQHPVSSPLVVARECIWRKVQIMQLPLRQWAACSPKRPLDSTGCPQKSFSRTPNG